MKKLDSKTTPIRNKREAIKPVLKTPKNGLSEQKKRVIEEAVRKIVREYKETLRLLGRE